MGTPTQLFDVLCSKLKLQRFSPIPNDLIEAFESHRKIAVEQIKEIQAQFLPGKTINIYFDYIDCGKLNVVAGIRDNLSLIGIFKGAVILLKDLFQRMLSHPDVLPWIGDVRRESYVGQLSEGIIANSDKLYTMRTEVGLPQNPRIPNDIVRQEFSVAVSQFATDFLVYHEIAHIVIGHLGLLNKTSGIGHVLEVSEHSPALKKPNIVRQAIEMGADNTATGISIERLFNTKKPLPNEWSQFLSTDEQRLYVWCFSIAGLFRFWGLKIDPVNIRGSEYPPTAMRLAMALGTAKLTIKNIRPSLESQFDIISKAALQALGDSIAAIGGPRLLQEDIDPLYSTEGKAHHTRILKCWQRLLPRLRRYSYVRLPEC